MENAMYVDVKVEGINEEIKMEVDDKIEQNKPGSGISDYEELDNLPRINGVKLLGNKTSEDLKLQPEGEYLTNEDIEREVVDIDFSDYFK